MHTPFCLHKCHYCDFNSHVFKQPPWDDYAKALLAELAYYAAQPKFANRRISSVFFGGGTPSLAPASLFADVIQDAQRLFGLMDDAEISLEANPGASEIGRFKAYRYAGVNRLSIGVQSFHDDELKWLERVHSSDEANKAYAMAREAGFSNINLDLMYALPNQTLDVWFESLEKALAMKPEHLSCYQLTVEPHTALFVTHQKKKLALPDEDLALDFLWQTRQRLAQAGYVAYEISNFAQPDKSCQHNQGYWQYDDYIGIGAGAAGKWDLANGGTHRYSNIRSPQTYIQAALTTQFAVLSDEDLSLGEAMGEAVWLGLRQAQGLNLSWFKLRFGRDIEEVFAQNIKKWIHSGKIVKDNGNIKLTDSGLSLADDIAASFLVVD